MADERRLGRDLRRYARSTNVRLVAGGMALILVVGGGLIWAFYGPQALMSALLCFGAFALPVALIAALLWCMGWIVRKERGR